MDSSLLPKRAIGLRVSRRHRPTAQTHQRLLDSRTGWRSVCARLLGGNTSAPCSAVLPLVVGHITGQAVASTPFTRSTSIDMPPNGLASAVWHLDACQCVKMMLNSRGLPHPLHAMLGGTPTEMPLPLLFLTVCDFCFSTVLAMEVHATHDHDARWRFLFL